MKRLLTAILSLVSLAALAATPTITVTLSDYTLDYSGYGYVVRLTPLTAGSAMRELTAADSIATFANVTPGRYNLTIEGVGVPTLEILVPDSSSTIAASTLITTDWTAPGATTSMSTPFFRSVPYLWPASQGAANTALANDGAGLLSWTLFMPPSLNLSNWASIATTTKQPASANLTNLSNGNGSGLTNVQPAATALTNLANGNGSGLTNVQPASLALTNLAIGDGSGLTNVQPASTTLTNLSIGDGSGLTNVQPASAALTNLAALDGGSLTNVHLDSGALITNLVGWYGTATTPDFATDPGTGMFKSATNAIGFATGGTERWVINASGAFNPVAAGYDIGNGTVNPRDITIDRYFNSTNFAASLPVFTDASKNLTNHTISTTLLLLGIQAGTVAAAADGTITQAFTSAYSSAPVVVVGSTATNENAHLLSATTSNFIAATLTAGSNINWIAIGPP